MTERMSLQVLSTQCVINDQHLQALSIHSVFWKVLEFGPFGNIHYKYLRSLDLGTVYLECKGGLSVLLACFLVYVYTMINQQGYCVLYAL